MGTSRTLYERLRHLIFELLRSSNQQAFCLLIRYWFSPYSLWKKCFSLLLRNWDIVSRFPYYSLDEPVIATGYRDTSRFPYWISKLFQFRTYFLSRNLSENGVKFKNLIQKGWNSSRWCNQDTFWKIIQFLRIFRFLTEMGL